MTEPVATTEQRYFALDKVAKHAPRRHRLMTQEYAFQPNLHVAMPFEDAKILIGNPDFEVRSGSPNGPLQALVKDEDEGGNAVMLRSDQCIADFAELTNDALAARCRKLEGGDDFRRVSPKESMIAFLTNSRVKEEEARQARAPGKGRRDENGALVVMAD